MKQRILFLILIIICTNVYAQFSEQQIITTLAEGAISVHAADIDNDGDMDVVSASWEDDKIAWYENTDGLGSFGTQQIITIETDGARFVYASDIDNDGDMDILSASWFSDEIAWYENVNGLGDFSAKQLITITQDVASSVQANDIDGDGFMDVIFSSSADNKIAWLKNIDGEGTFGTVQTITVQANNATSVYTADIDGDGDIDVLSSAFYDHKIAWYENIDGLGSFGEQQIITDNASGANQVFVVDIDSDGDLDVLSASNLDDKIAWYENTNGLGAFSSQIIITTNADYAYSVFATDLDGDNDIDVLSASANDNKIAWYENIDGLGSFGEQQIITINATFANSVFASDLDGDGDMDVLSASSNDNKIAWYENLNSLGVDENILTLFSIHPNPVTNVLTLETKTDIVQINVYNELGQIVISKSQQNFIDFSTLSQGLYFLKLEDVNGLIEIKKVIKN